MSFHVEICEYPQLCDICKVSDVPLIALEVKSRDRDNHQFIVVHERCLLKKIASAKKRRDAEAEKGTPTELAEVKP